MSNEVTVIPDAARDANLTPTQRFEAIVRAQPGMTEYQAPRSTGEVTTRSGAKVPHAVVEHAQYLERSRDKNGMVTAEQFVSGGMPFTFGYDVPAGYSVDPVGLRTTLEVAARAKVPKEHVFNFLVEFGKLVR